MSEQETVSEPGVTKCCRKINWVSYCMSIGAGLGIVFGGAIESPYMNSGLGLTLGVGIGVAVGSALKSRACA